ncbi:MAG: 1-deoxy-D-xylulose-5-phosphate synthase, partial [Bacteroidales bacterium]|nr:1-deoxy-D-xylulose-5-phosphate synthase [Bacteroidales bacterium]
PDKGTFVIRYPRGRGSIEDWQCPLEEVPIGKGRKLKEGKDIALVSIGPIGYIASEAIQEAEKLKAVSIAHYDLRFLKPLDEEMLHEIGTQFDKIVTVEDGIKKGGMSSALLEFFSENNYKPTLKSIGVPDEFIEHGTVEELYHICGMDKEAILKEIYNLVEDSKPSLK